MTDCGPLRRCITVIDPNGLHPRPATAFATLANRYESRVTVWFGDKPANGKTPWDLIMLVAMPGSELILEVEGPDAHEALEPLAAILAAANDDT